MLSQQTTARHFSDDNDNIISTDKMRVVEVVIDGFKSYAVRTVISGWDESFNSITGLNGSGKSNILDSICFVLGITNMSTVRAANLQVYLCAL